MKTMKTLIIVALITLAYSPFALGQVSRPVVYKSGNVYHGTYDGFTRPHGYGTMDFPNGDSYMPVGVEQRFGRIVREDSIAGKIARVICVRTVNQKELDQKYLDYINKTRNLLQGATFDVSDIAGADDGIVMEEQPLPMADEYYFQVRGEIFQASPKNILSHIDPKRKQEYRNFTRSAEIISTNESSMLKVWQEFFLK